MQKEQSTKWQNSFANQQQQQQQRHIVYTEWENSEEAPHTAALEEGAYRNDNLIAFVKARQSRILISYENESTSCIYLSHLRFFFD